MAVKDIIAAGIGFFPLQVSFILSRGLGAFNLHNPFAPKIEQVNRTQKGMHTDNKPKAVQVTNPFRVVK